MLVLAPVSLHRTLFRQGKKGVLVAWTNRLLRISLAIVALTVVGVVVLLFDVATNFGLAVAAGVVAALVLGTLWFAIPMSLRRRH
jgi:membrane protein YdbS with pleckstrin-like domain